MVGCVGTTCAGWLPQEAMQCKWRRESEEGSQAAHHQCARGFCTVPVRALGAVAQQPDKILVPDAADRLHLHPELPLGLPPACGERATTSGSKKLRSPRTHTDRTRKRCGSSSCLLLRRFFFFFSRPCLGTFFIKRKKESSYKRNQSQLGPVLSVLLGPYYKAKFSRPGTSKLANDSNCLNPACDQVMISSKTLLTTSSTV